MSNKEQTFQRCLDSAAELEGGLRLSRKEWGSASRFSSLQINSRLNFVRSGKAGIASLAVSPLVQMGLPASFLTQPSKVWPLSHQSAQQQSMVFCSVSGLPLISQIDFSWDPKRETPQKGKTL